MFAGVDVGRAADHTGIVIMAGDEVTAIHRFPLGLDWKTIVSNVEERVAGCSRVVIDATGVGSPIVEALSDRLPCVIPFAFTAQSKRELMLLLIAAINGGKVKIPPQPNRDILSEELKRFAASPTRTGWRFSGKSSGKKDDMVMSLAMCLYAQFATQGGSNG